ncbi:MAG: SUKH-3 domain-containing protein, partial [Oscillospiraceae bacterium]|nr:SUKH-3 domain-containing protein [Oscillospiraceae bacterium]
YGWYQDRKVNIDNIIQYFAECELHTFKKGLDFLEEFSGLNISINNKITNSVIELNALKGIENSAYLEDIESYFRIKLMPIGYWRAMNRTLYIDEIGIIYGNTDGFVTIFGNSFHEALDNIINLKTIKNFLV